MQLRSFFTMAALLAFALPQLASASAYKVAPDKSQVRWTATKVTGAHNGTAPVKEGRFEMKDGLVTKGKIEIDLAKLKVLDLTDPKYNSDLTGHLKSDDFFSTDKHPIATFEVEKAVREGDKQVLEGKLTLKGKAEAVKIPVTVTPQGDREVKLAGKAKLDRTLWDIKYRSGKFFPNIGDKMIHDEFEVDFDLVAATDAGADAKPLKKGK